MTTLNVLLQGEISDFFASFGGLGTPEIQSGEAQRQLIDRVLSVVASQQAATVPDAWTWEQAREFVRREDISFPVEAAYSAVKSFWAASQQAPAASAAESGLVDSLILAIEKEQDRLFKQDYLMDSKDCVDVIREEFKRLSANQPAVSNVAGYRKLFTCSACGSEGLDEPIESRCHCCEDGARWIEGRLYTAPPEPAADPQIAEYERIEQTDAARVARAALDYIDAIPAEVAASLPAMPGFDRDWAESVVAACHAPEPLYTCPACGEQSYEDLGGGCLRCADCSHQFTKLEGKP